MLNLGLLDALVVVFVAWRLLRSARQPVGESLHALVALLVLVGLFFGFRMAGEVRALLSEVADWLRLIPGLGSKLLVLLATWYLMWLLRKRVGHWIEAVLPEHGRRTLGFAVAAARALVLAGFGVWLIEGWFPRDRPAAVPLSVAAVRQGEAWAVQLVGQDTGSGVPPARAVGPPPPPWVH